MPKLVLLSPGERFTKWQRRLGLTSAALADSLAKLDQEGKGVTTRTISNLRSGLRPGLRIDGLLRKLAKQRRVPVAPILSKMRPH